MPIFDFTKNVNQFQRYCLNLSHSLSNVLIMYTLHRISSIVIAQDTVAVDVIELQFCPTARTACDESTIAKGTVSCT